MSYETSEQQMQADGGAMFQAIVARLFDASGPAFCLYSEGGKWVIERGPHSRVKDRTRFVGESLAEVVGEALECAR